MKLTAQQIAALHRAMSNLERADCDIQAALPAGEYCYELHSRIDDICAEIEQMIEEEIVPEEA